MKRFAVLGHPIGHSFSPIMHTASFRSIGFDGEYTRRDVPPETLKAALDALAQEGLDGVNLTIPHKQLAVPMMDALTPEAKRLGAVNTVRFKDGKMYGHNTDGPGFLAAAKALLDFTPQGETAAVIGCGGAGRAISLSLAYAGAKWIGLIDVDQVRAKQLADEIQSQTQTRAEVITVERLCEAHLVAQCSPSGLAIMPEPAAPASAFRPTQVLYDIVIPPGHPETPTMRAFREAGGTRCANGVRMLVEQGALSFEFWTDGVVADRNAMLAAVETEVARHG
ncbi:MAG: shikimate dehydrogenase [Kiritimatiellae bacterium]|nr:shikimate dehydrogenase [Kiritimatiellia bacterium]